jgi:hypothetical protein
MKLEFVFIPVLTLLFSSPVFALCTSGSKTIFYCTTATGKQIEICDSKKTIEYSFGKSDMKPEIVVKVPRAQASTWQWRGVGRWHSYSVDIPNGNTTYNVFWGHDALSPNSPPEAGVNVLNNDGIVTTVLCTTKGIVQALEGIDLRVID